MILILRKKIFTKEFLDKFLKIFKVIDSENAFNDTSIRFVRYALEVLAGHPEVATVVEIVAFVFDSMLVAGHSDNFTGTKRLMDLLELMHSLTSKNSYLIGGRKRNVNPEVASMLSGDK